MSENRKDEFWRSMFNEDFPVPESQTPEPQAPDADIGPENEINATPPAPEAEPMTAYERKLARARERYDRREQKRLEREQARLTGGGETPQEKEPPASAPASPPPSPSTADEVEPEPWYREIPARFIESVSGMSEKRSMRRAERRLNMGEKELQREEERNAELDRYRESPIRQYRAKKTGCVGALLYFVFVVCVSVVLAAFGWMTISDVLAFGFEDSLVEMTVPEDFEMDELISELKDKGLIKYEKVFRIYAKLTNAQEDIDPGTYTLNTNYDYSALVSYMHNYGSFEALETVQLRISEGSTIWQVIDTLAENGVCDKESLLDAAANYDFDYYFLDDSTLGQANRLEGYLFPDTYEFYVDSAPEQALSRLLNNFEAKVSEQMLTDIEAAGRTVYEIVTIASLIEKETDGTDRENIASVIYNRLNNPTYETVGLLQIDAALYYGLEKSMDEQLTEEDLTVDTPYNTYIYEGLTPTPIASPSMASINAAVYPADTDYFYYALGNDNLHHYSRTLAEHNYFLSTLG